jgi:epoxyqueuosine reductase
MPTSISEPPDAAGADDLRTAIRTRAEELGFDAFGIAAPDSVTAAGRHLHEALARGWHGDMAWLAAKADRRADPRALWPEVGAIIMLGQSYAEDGDPLKLLGMPDRGLVSVYARRRDYHDVLKKRLKQIAGWLHREHGAQVKVFVDTAPVLEKPLAQAAGLGWQGKHSNLVSRRHGSWLFLGAIYTDLDLPADARHADRCGTCRRCLDACPTDAFPAPYRLDARRCIAYLTIEHQGHIDAEFRPAIGNRVFGCDDCLAACPWNRFAALSRDAALWPRAELTAPRIADMLDLDEDGFRLLTAGTPLRRLGHARFLRNVLIAAGNSGIATMAARIEPHLDAESPLVRAMAVWALGRLGPPARLAGLRARHLPDETDTAVRAEWEAAGDGVTSP